MSQRPLSLWKYEGALLFTVVVWGMNFPVIKLALAAMHPHVINGFRFVVSAAVLGSLYVAQGQHHEFSLRRSFARHGRAIVALSLTGYLLYQLAFILGINRTTAGNAALIMAGAPLWTAVVGRVFGYETLRRGAWAGLLVILTGTVVIVLGSAAAVDLSNDTFVGNVLMLGASMLWGGYTAFSKPVLRDLPATTLIFYAVLVALPFLLLLAGANVREVDWEAVTPMVWLAIIFSGGLSTGLVIVFWSAGIRHVGASHTAAYGNIVPIVAVVGSVLMLGEAIRLVQIIGACLIVGGLVVMRRFRAPLPA